MLSTLFFELIVVLFLISRPSKRFLILLIPLVLILIAFLLRMWCRFFSSLIFAWYLLLILSYQLLASMVLFLRLCVSNTTSYICHIQVVCFPSLMMMMMRKRKRRRRRRIMLSREDCFIFYSIKFYSCDFFLLVILAQSLLYLHLLRITIFFI